MYYRNILIAGLVLLMFTRFQCYKPVYPGLVETDILVIDEDSNPIAGVPLFISKSGCIQDTFRTNSEGKAFYSFFSEARDNGKFGGETYFINVLPKGFLSKQGQSLLNSGKYSAELQTKKTKPLLSVLVKASTHDSIHLLLRQIGNDLSFGCIGLTSLPNIELDNNFLSITNTSSDFNTTLIVPTNDTTELIARFFDTPMVRDSLIKVAIQEDVVELVL